MFNCRFRFSLTPTFFEVTFDCTLSFSKHVSSLKAKLFPRLKALCCISAFSRGPSKESLSLLCKAFLRPLFTYASPGWFPFLRVTNSIKLKDRYRVASRVITGFLLLSPIPILVSKASLPPLRVTLTHFALSSYQLAFCLPNSFPNFRFGQTSSETKILQILPESFCVHSPLHASFCFSWGDSLCLPSLPLEPAFLYCGVHSFLPMFPL